MGWALSIQFSVWGGHGYTVEGDRVDISCAFSSPEEVKQVAEIIKEAMFVTGWGFGRGANFTEEVIFGKKVLERFP